MDLDPCEYRMVNAHLKRGDLAKSRVTISCIRSHPVVRVPGGTIESASTAGCAQIHVDTGAGLCGVPRRVYRALRVRHSRTGSLPGIPCGIRRQQVGGATDTVSMARGVNSARALMHHVFLMCQSRCDEPRVFGAAVGCMRRGRAGCSCQPWVECG